MQPAWTSKVRIVCASLRLQVFRDTCGKLPTELLLRSAYLVVDQPRTTCSHFAADVAPKAVTFVLDFAQVPEIIVRQTEVNT